MSEYMKILKMIENGEISPEEAAELFKNIGTDQSMQDEGELDTLGILAKIEQGELSADQGISLISVDKIAIGLGSKGGASGGGSGTLFVDDIRLIQP